MLFHRLDDEWVPLERVQVSRTIKISHLPPRAKVRLAEKMLQLRGGVPDKARNARKRKRSQVATNVA